MLSRQDRNRYDTASDAVASHYLSALLQQQSMKLAILTKVIDTDSHSSSLHPQLVICTMHMVFR